MVKQSSDPVMMKQVEKLREHARRMRMHIIRMTSAAGSGHPGPAFSPVEILAAAYFSPRSPSDPDRRKLTLWITSLKGEEPCLPRIDD